VLLAGTSVQVDPLDPVVVMEDLWIHWTDQRLQRLMKQAIKVQVKNCCPYGDFAWRSVEVSFEFQQGYEILSSERSFFWC
jgi:hypothetical protein